MSCKIVKSKHLKGRSGDPASVGDVFPSEGRSGTASVGHVFPSEGCLGPHVSGTCFSLGRSFGTRISGTRFSLGRSFGTPHQWDTFFPRKVVRDPASVGDVFTEFLAGKKGHSGPHVSG